MLSVTLASAAQQPAAAPTIGSTCKRVDREKEGDSVWLTITPKGLAFCAELHDAFRRTKWIVALPDRTDNPTFSTEAMARAFIEKQPAPKQ